MEFEEMLKSELKILHKELYKDPLNSRAIWQVASIYHWLWMDKEFCKACEFLIDKGEAHPWAIDDYILSLKTIKDPYWMKKAVMFYWSVYHHLDREQSIKYAKLEFDRGNIERSIDILEDNIEKSPEVAELKIHLAEVFCEKWLVDELKVLLRKMNAHPWITEEAKSFILKRCEDNVRRKRNVSGNTEWEDENMRDMRNDDTKL